MEIYTIGHSKHSIKEFISLLKKYNINCIVDVRSTPYSKYSPQFNKETFAKTLKNNKITYIHMGEEFGARRSDKSLYFEDGILDFEKTKRDITFKRGVKRIKTGLEKGYKIAFMCTEQDPIECHRCILVGKGIQDILKINIKNILPDGGFYSQREIDKRLLDKYYPNRYQCDMFDVEKKSDEELLEDAYVLANKEIGYELE